VQTVFECALDDFLLTIPLLWTKQSAADDVADASESTEISDAAGLDGMLLEYIRRRQG
jgi:hypothetical protein